MNVITISGRIAKEIELKQSNTGTPYVSLVIADDYFDKGEYKTNFFNCFVFGKQAEYIANYGLKGLYVVVYGNARINKKDNNYYTSIMVNNVKVLKENKEKQEKLNNQDEYTATPEENEEDFTDEIFPF